MLNGENSDEKFSNLFEKFLNSYKRTGKIGYVKPYNLEHAKKVAYMAVKRIITTNLLSVEIILNERKLK